MQRQNLIQKQKQIEVESLAKRSKQHPRSADLVNENIKEVVASLEKRFDSYEVNYLKLICIGPEITINIHYRDARLHHTVGKIGDNRQKYEP